MYRLLGQPSRAIASMFQQVPVLRVERRPPESRRPREFRHPAVGAARPGAQVLPESLALFPCHVRNKAIDTCHGEA